MNIIKNRDELTKLRDTIKSQQSTYKNTIYVCGGAGCVSSHCDEIVKTLTKAVEDSGLSKDIRIVVTGCIGLCAYGPCLVVDPDGVFYGNLTPEKVLAIVDRHLKGGEIAKEFCYYDEDKGDYLPFMKDIGFFSEQVKIALRNCGRVDFASVEDYIANDGYQALAKVIMDMGREKTVQEILDSGLRGRGGAGFPTGIKWQAGMNQPGDQKYMICNADEGDPGAFMDRSVLEGDPHSVIEAMAIAGFVIGANKGYVYVRAEYPIAVERLGNALDQARAAGLLGTNILGTGFEFDIEIRIGAGAFVCGEETALINSIEGKRGEPRQKPPFPFQSGLWNVPTIINNVETLANVPAIILKGAAWFSSYGVGKSRGTKVFALAGDIVNAGIIEIPMGMSLRNVIYKMGGGMKDGKAFKAVQSGGPSGGCLTSDHLDVSVDYESLSAMGAIMGSGGLIAMDENTCLVDTARYFMEFVQDESCGHCVPCRNGTKRMLELLLKITSGRGEMTDLDELADLAVTVGATAMCGLGQTAPNPVLTTLKYFKDEYLAHVVDKKCPAHICKALGTYTIDPEKCRGCTACAKKCPADAITGEVKKPHVISLEKCIKCGACMEACKFDAVAYN
ncbi:NADH-quinone oxidoreductase subunit NuoF [Oscillospiraceae bacterium CM]|nr:NADH-quinone oxidoreductase subunit NuoF [Oscillospiraceae bacterium CM]